jgi:hypothetical protein
MTFGMGSWGLQFVCVRFRVFSLDDFLGSQAKAACVDTTVQSGSSLNIRASYLNLQTCYIRPGFGC